MMKRRTVTVVALLIIASSIALLGLWIANTGNPSETEETEKSQAQSAEDMAEEYADKSSSMEEVSEEINALIQSNQLTVEEAEWLKARIGELRNIASRQQMSTQPETLEEYIQYFAEYNSQDLSDIKTAQRLYEQYLRNPGPDSPITQSTLQALNQAKLKESFNILNIDAEINQLVVNGTLTSAEGAWLKEQVYRLRTL